MALEIQSPVPSFTRNSRLLHSPTRPNLVVRFQKPSGQKNRWWIRPSPVEKPVEEPERLSSSVGSAWGADSTPPRNVWMDKDLIPTYFFLFTLVLYFVGRRYLRYLEAKWEIEDSEEFWRETLEQLEAIPKHKWEQMGTHMFILKRWGKRRKEATAYMEKHKLMGKVVEFFHPKKIDNS